MSEAPSDIRGATRGDLPEIVDLLRTCDVAEIGRPDTTLEDLETDWELDGFTPATDAWVAQTGDGRLVGFAYAGDQFRTGELEGDLWVEPGRAEPGLGARMLGLVERRAAELAAARGYRHATLGMYAITVNQAKRDLLRRRGYGLRRTIHRMRIDLGDGFPQLEPPAGLTIRPFDPVADVETMHVTMNDAFEDHFRQSNESLESWRQRLLGHPDFDPALWALAWDGDEPVGGLIAYDHHDVGWVKGLGVRAPWRRQGLGSALLSHAFAVFAERGQLDVELGVDAEGETRPLRVYERAGMRATHTYELYERTLTA